MEVVKLKKEDWKNLELKYRWETSYFYRVEVFEDDDGWTVKVKRASSNEKIVKSFSEYLYKPWMEECELYGVQLDGKIIAWMSVGYERWCNRLRIFELYVLEESEEKELGPC